MVVDDFFIFLSNNRYGYPISNIKNSFVQFGVRTYDAYEISTSIIISIMMST